MGSPGNSYCCAYYEGDECVESFIAHIDSSLKVWRHLKPYYIGSVTRAAGYLDLDPVEFALVVHDFGKLAREYRVNRRGYRHELISSYVAYEVLRDLAGRLDLGDDVLLSISLAVLLHHESIIMSAYVSSFGERYLTVSNIRRVVEKADLGLGCDVSSLIDYLGRLSSYSRSAGIYIDYVVDFLSRWGTSPLPAERVVDGLRYLILRSSVGDPDSLHVIRAKAAAVLHPLVVSDSIAAYVSRSLCRDRDPDSLRDEGTWVVRRVLSGAEPIDLDLVKSSICGGSDGH